jgi:hypothetical protein
MLPDKTTLRGFLDRIERQYGKARRIWLMDRGVPTEEVLARARADHDRNRRQEAQRWHALQRFDLATDIGAGISSHHLHQRSVELSGSASGDGATTR